MHIPLGCPGADLPPHPEAIYTAIAQVGAVGGRDVPGHSGGLSPSVSGALGAPGASGDASPGARSAPRTVPGGQRAADGAVGGALGSLGAGGDASPSAQSTLRTVLARHRAVGGAAGAWGWWGCIPQRPERQSYSSWQLPGCRWRRWWRSRDTCTLWGSHWRGRWRRNGAAAAAANVCLAAREMEVAIDANNMGVQPADMGCAAVTYAVATP